MSLEEIIRERSMVSLSNPSFILVAINESVHLDTIVEMCYISF